MVPRTRCLLPPVKKVAQGGDTRSNTSQTNKRGTSETMLKAPAMVRRRSQSPSQVGSPLASDTSTFKVQEWTTGYHWIPFNIGIDTWPTYSEGETVLVSRHSPQVLNAQFLGSSVLHQRQRSKTDIWNDSVCPCDWTELRTHVLHPEDAFANRTHHRN